MTMNKKIKVLTLKNCSFCSNYREMLRTESIEYQEIDCYENSNCDSCDSYERISGCNTYPMTIYNDELIICLTSEYDQIGNISNNGKHNILYCHSIDNMLDITKKLLHLK